MRSGAGYRRFGLGALSFLAMAAGLSPSLGSTPAQAAPAVQSAPQTCTDHAIETEKRLRIPSGLLLSMALVESGSGGEPRTHALNINGRVKSPRTVRDAAKLLRDGKGNLRRDVYVGCMQLSLDHHRGAFQPVEKIVEPASNVAYAGRLLVRLRNETGSWAQAVGRYQGGSVRQQAGYQCKVWNYTLQLEPKTARLFDAARCQDFDVASVGRNARRAFRQSQVASAD